MPDLTHDEIVWNSPELHEADCFCEGCVPIHLEAEYREADRLADAAFRASSANPLSGELHDAKMAACERLYRACNARFAARETSNRRRGLCETCRDDLDFGGVMAHHCSECGR